MTAFAQVGKVRVTAYERRAKRGDGDDAEEGEDGSGGDEGERERTEGAEEGKGKEEKLRWKSIGSISHTVSYNGR